MLVPAALAPGPQAPMEASGWSCRKTHRAVSQREG
jgi:hypothetical protein